MTIIVGMVVLERGYDQYPGLLGSGIWRFCASWLAHGKRML